MIIYKYTDDCKALSAGRNGYPQLCRRRVLGVRRYLGAVFWQLMYRYGRGVAKACPPLTALWVSVSSCRQSFAIIEHKCAIKGNENEAEKIRKSNFSEHGNVFPVVSALCGICTSSGK